MKPNIEKGQSMMNLIDGIPGKEKSASSAILEFYKMCDFFDNLDADPQLVDLKAKIQEDWEKKDPSLFSTFGDNVTVDDVYETAKATIMLKESYRTLGVIIPEEILQFESKRMLAMIRSKEEILTRFSKDLPVN